MGEYYGKYIITSSDLLADPERLFMDHEENIYEPVSLFQSRFKDSHSKNVSDFFEDLFQKSGVDAAKNADTVAQINAKQKEIDTEDKKRKSKRKLKGFCIFLIVVFGAAIVVFALSLYDPTLFSIPWPSLYFILLIIGSVLGIVGLSLIIGLNLQKAIKILEKTLAKLNKDKQDLLNIAWKQMEPLNSLFDWGMTQALVQKTIPLVHMDPYFDNQRFEFLRYKYGLADNSALGRSVTYVQSGEIAGNPFLLARVLDHWMGTKTYDGSLTITWTTTTYVNGHWETENHTQTLHASVTKPFPFYQGKTYVIYGNEAAPDLSFSREPSGANKMNEREIAHFVDQKAKKIEKMAQKSVTNGGSFTALGEQEFDALFGAVDRDNEVQFRLLFTPLAQRELLTIIKDKVVGFGDDFSFQKQKGLNYVSPAHMQNQDLSGDPSYFASFSLAYSRQAFNDYNNGYFKAFYFAMAPLLAIPIYQQQKPHEFIYRNVYRSNVSCYEHEYLANQLPIDKFKNPISVTTNILKTQVLASSGSADTVQVTAHGFQGINHIDYVSVYGGDGFYHSVPVPWVEYSPVSKVTPMVIGSSELINRANIAGHKDWQSFLNGASQAAIFRQGILAFVSMQAWDETALSKISEVIK